MKVIDMHCDTLWRIDEDPTQPLRHNDLMVDLEKMKKSDYMCQNFAVYTDISKGDQVDTVMSYIDTFYNEMDANKDMIAPVLSVEDIERNEKEGKMSALLTIEEGDVIHGDLAYLRNYYRLGVRMIALSHNHVSSITHPHTTHEGLTELGKEYIKEMDRLGMIIDVSHMSDECFYEILELTSKPFVASHSNARSVCNHSRNMSDDMILKLAERGGVMGINFYSAFLEEGAEYSKVEDMVKHILYIKELAGIDVIGLGSDFDGIDCELEMKDASYMHLLEDALYEAGLTQEEVEKIFYKNVLRVYKEVLG